jgi:hypothetical protein
MTPTPTKKQRIKELIADGNYSASDVARMVGTSIANVWKEKSNLRRSNLVMGQKVERSEKSFLVASSAHDIVRSNMSRTRGGKEEYRELLDLPMITSEDLKILYRELCEGKKPDEIIAAHGFHPEVVEAEYRRVNKLDSRSLLHRIVNEVIMFKLGLRGEELIAKYRREGELSEDEVIELLKANTDAASALAFGATRFHP